MSKESAAKFVQAALEDEALRERTENMKPGDAVPLAREMGYDFTVEELTEVMKDTKELSLEELGSVAGGNVVGGPCTAEVQTKKIKDTYCYGDVNGRRHDYEKVLQGKRTFLFFFKKSFDVYKCRLCGHQMEK